MELIHLPKIGLAAEPATVREFLKAQGDSVVIGDEILAIETEKAVVEVQSSGIGTLGRFLVAVDDVIAPGTAIAVILDFGETFDEMALERLLLSSRPADAPSTESVLSEAVQSAAPASRPVAVKATPRVRKLAADRGIDLALIQGTGPDGLITEVDLDEGPGDGSAGNVRLSGIHAAIASRMARAWREIPHIHQIIEIEADALLEARRRLGVSLTPLLIKAAAIALERHPTINAHFDGETLVHLKNVNIAVAVGDDDTLLTPVIQNADRLSVREIAQALDELRERVAAGRLTAADLSDGSYTLSNLGMYGIDTGTPIINPPQVGLMFVGATKARPVLHGTIEARQFMKITLSYDHRVVSGIPAARFSREIQQLLQNPEWAGT